MKKRRGRKLNRSQKRLLRGAALAVFLAVALFCGATERFDRLTALPAMQTAALPTLVPTPAPTEAVLRERETVYLPRSGERYHRTPACGAMKDGRAATRAEAEAAGYKPCGRCWK